MPGKRSSSDGLKQALCGSTSNQALRPGEEGPEARALLARTADKLARARRRNGGPMPTADEIRQAAAKGLHSLARRQAAQVGEATEPAPEAPEPEAAEPDPEPEAASETAPAAAVPPPADPGPGPEPSKGPDPAQEEDPAQDEAPADARAGEPGGAPVPAPQPRPLPGEDRTQMIARLYAGFAAQMDRLETRLHALEAEAGEAGEGGAAPVDLGEIDKTVKTLASLARTLATLLDLQAVSGREPDGRGRGKGDNEDGDAPSDKGAADALRSTLAQRLERLCGSGPD